MKSLNLLTLLIFAISSQCFSITLETWDVLSSDGRTYPYKYVDLSSSIAEYPSFLKTRNDAGDFSIGGTRSFKGYFESNSSSSDPNRFLNLDIELLKNGDRGYLSQSAGLLAHQKTKLSFVYDGDNYPGLTNFTGLGCLNLFSDNSNQIEALVHSDKDNLTMRITIFDARDPSGSTFVSYANTKNFNSLNSINYVFPFSSFTGTGNINVLSCVGAIFIEIDTPFEWGHDWEIEKLTTNGSCTQVPQKGELVADDCGICKGNNSDKDRCGVCYGNGLSCCKNIKQEDVQQEIDKRGYDGAKEIQKLSNLIKKVARVQKNKKIQKKLLKLASYTKKESKLAAYAAWLAIWAFESDTLNCEDIDGTCVTTVFSEEEANYLTAVERLSQAKKSAYKAIKKYASRAIKKKAKKIVKKFNANESETIFLFNSLIKTTEVCS